MLPSISKITQSVQSIKFNSAVVDLVYRELVDFKTIPNNKKKEEPLFDEFIFNNINFENVSFSYSTRKKKILNNINIEIKKGDKIGVIGKTGSGKSTFLNLFTGLLEPEDGKIKVNQTEIKNSLSSWQKLIGYVPQNVSIIDESVLFNISLEEDYNKIDLKKVDEVLKSVDLYDYIYSLPKKVHELAGEYGKNFSGGQCQRLGIARALYRNPEIIVLDESTNALDTETEEQIINYINNIKRDKIIILVAHRKTALKNCDKIIKIENGNLLEVNNKSI